MNRFRLANGFDLRTECIMFRLFDFLTFRLFPPRRSLVSSLCALLAAALVGCRAPSLLITPVPGNREMEERVIERESLFAIEKVALIDVTGTIRNDATTAFFLKTDNPVSELLEQLTMAKKDPLVKAVILRINSPGGTVVASELMYDEIVHFRQETGKPVIAMLMDVAASGGYYIACACDQIVAQPSTVTGSIGVIMLTVDLSGTLQKLGARTDAIVSGPFKDAGSPFRSMTPKEREHFQGIIDDMYGRFLAVVAKGRPNLGVDGVKSLADGRVFTATQAVELGLVDAIATPRQTLEIVKQRIGARTVRLISYARPYEYRPNYYAAAPAQAAGDVNLIKIDAPTALTPPAPQFMYLWAPGQ